MLVSHRCIDSNNKNYTSADSHISVDLERDEGVVLASSVFQSPRDLHF